MVWIHGGGYTLGSKTLYSPSAAGLIKRSQENGSDGVIWVGINYRLGIFVGGIVSAPPCVLLTVGRFRAFSLVQPSKQARPQMQVFMTRDSRWTGYRRISICSVETQIASHLWARVPVVEA